ncbi:hypothetical protein [Tsuneonella amylolytica]|uniref:hypothetical protein n=1 Tax=Tsuneonella amylolytica TaxID=2338327 RepID=UPI0013C484C7|nr:hypothetical protein [Tsuneonella amylolytica]
MAAAVYITRSAVDDRIRELGLHREGLISAVRAASAAVAGCTVDSPPIARGWLAWHDAVVRLRQEFRPSGWAADDTANFATIFDEAAGIKVAVVNTDDGAGNPISFPTNRSRRGEFSKMAIESNQLRLPFLEPDEAKSPGVTTWYLCIYAVGETVRAELSLPTKCEGGIIGGWKERIILVSGDNDLRVRSPIDLDDGPEFRVQISRK